MRNVDVYEYCAGSGREDTFPGRGMRISPIERENHEGPRIFERPHLLAPNYRKEKVIKSKSK